MSVGAALGLKLGERVGTVGEFVGESLGACVGERLGESVGAVGLSLGAALGEIVGNGVVGNEVGSAVKATFTKSRSSPISLLSSPRFEVSPYPS